MNSDDPRVNLQPGIDPPMNPLSVAALRTALLLVLTLSGMAANAAGKCVLWTAGGYPKTRTVYASNTTLLLPADRYDSSGSTNFQSPNVIASGEVFPRDDGGFATYPGALVYEKPYMLCDSGIGNWTMELKLEGLGAPIPGTSPAIYPSGVEGVGIRARMGLGNWVPFSNHYGSAVGFIGGKNVFNWTVERFWIDLVAISTLAHQGDAQLGMTKQATMTISFKQGGAGPDLRVMNLVFPPVKIVRGTCSVQDTPVQMGRIPLSAFAASDAPAAAAKDFSIKLTCNAAMKMTYMLDSSNIYSRFDGILSLDASPITAKNVGLQIQEPNGGTVLLQYWRPSTGPDLQMVPGLNSIPLRAQYRRLKPGPITPGLANASATVTMQYK